MRKLRFRVEVKTPHQEEGRTVTFTPPASQAWRTPCPRKFLISYLILLLSEEASLFPLHLEARVLEVKKNQNNNHIVIH
jgi:hypothetical protein